MDGCSSLLFVSLLCELWGCVGCHGQGFAAKSSHGVVKEKGQALLHEVNTLKSRSVSPSAWRSDLIHCLPLLLFLSKLSNVVSFSLPYCRQILQTLSLKPCKILPAKVEATGSSLWKGFCLFHWHRHTNRLKFILHPRMGWISWTAWLTARSMGVSREVSGAEF